MDTVSWQDKFKYFKDGDDDDGAGGPGSPGDDDDDNEPEHISAGPSSYSGIWKKCWLTTCYIK